MRIATFNCNSVRARLDAAIEWIQKHQPDLFALQETKVVDQLFPVAPFQALGYHATFRGMKGYNGVALLSRVAPDSVRFGLDDGGPADEARLIHARFGPLHVVNTYIPQGRAVDHPMFTYKLDWFERLAAYLRRNIATGESALWMGDLNVAAEPEDVFNPETRERHVCYHESVRRAFARIKAAGWLDLYRKHHPEPHRYSFFDYRADFSEVHPEGWRLDYILATEPLASSSRDAWIDLQPRCGPRPSDHCPVVVELQV